MAVEDRNAGCWCIGCSGGCGKCHVIGGNFPGGRCIPVARSFGAIVGRTYHNHCFVRFAQQMTVCWVCQSHVECFIFREFVVEQRYRECFFPFTGSKTECGWQVGVSHTMNTCSGRSGYINSSCCFGASGTYHLDSNCCSILSDIHLCLFHLKNTLHSAWQLILFLQSNKIICSQWIFCSCYGYFYQMHGRTQTVKFIQYLIGGCSRRVIINGCLENIIYIYLHDSLIRTFGADKLEPSSRYPKLCISCAIAGLDGNAHTQWNVVLNYRPVVSCYRVVLRQSSSGRQRCSCQFCRKITRWSSSY